MSSPAYRAPAELAEVTQILAEYGADAKVLAGGTALVLQLKQRLATPRVLVSLQRVPGLSGMTENQGGLHIGARATLRDLETSPLVAERLPAVQQTVTRIASVRIRNQATIGGNVAIGDPVVDLPPMLVALDAGIRLSSVRGERTVPVADFYVDRLATAAAPDEVIIDVYIPVLPPRNAAVYLKYLPRTVVDYGTVGVAVRLALDEAGERVTDVRLALAGAGPTTVRAREAEQVLRGEPADAAALAQAATVVRSSVSPSSDCRGSAEYKRGMAEVFVRRALTKSVEDARSTLRRSG